MARRRSHRHSRRGHAGRKWIGLAGKVLGGLIVAAPALKYTFQDVQAGVPQAIPADVLFGYTGYATGGGTVNQGFDAAELGAGVASIVGGLIVMKVFSIVARKF